MIAEHWNLRREDNERYALASHQRAITAISAGRFAREISPYAGVAVDEGPRADTSLEKMAALPTLTEGGVLTAAVASQISDGAAALLIASQDAVDRFGLTPRARIHHMSVRGSDPVMMLTAPIPATQHALKRTGMSIDDFDAVEINEAFAPVVLAWLAELDADPERVNPNGGAIALGHPIGCTGRAVDDLAAARIGAHRRALRTADHVRGRRAGQRHHRRTVVASAANVVWTGPRGVSRDGSRVSGT